MFRYGLALVALYFVNPEAHAQSYPSRPVQIVVPLAAGGAADTIARATARRLSEMWNQQVIVENKSGANTQIGATQVSKSAPDGHTLLVSAETTFVVNPYLYSKLSYDPGKDFVTVSGLAMVNQLLLVHPSIPAQTVQDLIALAKEKPHSVTFGTYGVGSAGHLNVELFQAMAGVQMPRTPLSRRSTCAGLDRRSNFLQNNSTILDEDLRPPQKPST